MLGFFVKQTATDIAINEQKENSHEKLELIESLIRSSIDAETEITTNFDNQYEAEADAISLLARKSADFEYSNAHIAELRELAGVDYLAVTDENDTAIAEDGTAPEADLNPHTYTSEIDGTHKVKLINNTADLNEALEKKASLAAVLDDVHVGQDGFIFAVHKEKKTIIFWPESELIGDQAEAHGIDVSAMTDGTDLDITIDGKDYFCSVKQIDNGLITTAVPYTEINSGLTATLAITMIIYVILAGVIILYCIFLSADHREDIKKGYNEKLGRRVLSMAVCGALFAFVVTLYTQTLFTLSRQSVTNNRRGTEMLETLTKNNNTLAEETEEYKAQYLTKAKLAAYITEHVPAEELTQEFMKELTNALNVDSVAVFDANGETVASDAALWSYSISTDKEDQSYEFWQVLNGNKAELVQDIMQDDSGNYKQYIARAITGEDHKTKGMVELAVTPEAVRKATLNTDLATVLKGIQIGKGGFAFAVNVSDQTFAYFPKEELIGQNVTDYGMQDYMIKADYNDFISIDGEKYYCASGEFSPYMTYIAVPYSAMNSAAFPVAAIATAVMFIFMLVLWSIFCFNSKSIAASGKEAAENKELIDVDMGEGRTAKSRAVGFRWSHNGVDWEAMTAGQKTMCILNNVLILLAFIILLGILAADKIFASDSLMHFILKGKWQRGVNIFSVTFCILIVIALSEITILLRRFIIWLAHSMNARGETICRMLDNFIRTLSVIVMIYFCLSTLGVDTKTLLASAGIISLFIGLGAQSLVSDILAGLFIIFESEFQVGDIVTIDGFCGTVAEIGIRTTKVKEGSGNVKIFSNSSVKNVLNMTKDYSYVSVDMCVDNGEDLVYVEKVLQDEFPNIRAKLPAIVDGPFYRGISELTDSQAKIKIVAKCAEKDRGQLERDLRRRLKLIYDKYNINGPAHPDAEKAPIEMNAGVSPTDELSAELFVENQKAELKATGMNNEEA